MDQTVKYSGTAIFAVEAASGTALSYQWYQAGLLFLNKKLMGQTSNTLTLTNVAYSAEGQYYVEVKNAGGKVNSRKAVLTVSAAPVASNDTYTTLEDVPLTVPAPGILLNDTDVDGDVLSAVLLSDVTHGSLSLAPAGGFTYTPNPDYNGSDTFTYSAHDGLTTGNVATVTIHITPVNDAPPVANHDTYTTLEDVPLTVSAPGMLLNDTDVDGDVLSAILLNDVTHGSLSLNAGGGFIYTPNTNHYGSDSFTYFAHDGLIPGNVATVTINITPVNDPPFAVNDSYVTPEDAPLIIPAAGSLTNDGDVEGGALTAVLVSNVSNGSLSFNTNGSFTYTPGTNFNGSDSFTYTAHDGQTAGNVATVTINVTPVNDPPLAVNDSYATPEDVPLIIQATGILTNDVDVDGDALTAALVSNVSKGSLNLNADGGFIYTPNPDYFGSDSFTYRAHDGLTTGNVATVMINITPVNDPPLAVNDSVSVLEDEPVNIRVLNNDSDPEGAPLTVTGTSTTNGTAVISAAGTRVLFTPSTNFNGVAVLSYTVSDGTNSATASVTVTIIPVNDAPVANNDTYSTPKDTPLTIPAAGILTNDVDADGDGLTAALASNASHGLLLLNPDGSFTYTPTSGYVGNDSFSYRARDASATSAVATVTITIHDSTPLGLGSVVLTADGFSFELSGTPDSTYVIEASTNLTDWTPISTNFTLTGRLAFTDTTAASHPWRFYRAMAR